MQRPFCLLSFNCGYGLSIEFSLTPHFANTMLGDVFIRFLLVCSFRNQ